MAFPPQGGGRICHGAVVQDCCVDTGTSVHREQQQGKKCDPTYGAGPAGTGGATQAAVNRPVVGPGPSRRAPSPSRGRVGRPRAGGRRLGPARAPAFLGPAGPRPSVAQPGPTRDPRAHLVLLADVDEGRDAHGAGRAQRRVVSPSRHADRRPERTLGRAARPHSRFRGTRTSGAGPAVGFRGLVLSCPPSCSISGGCGLRRAGSRAVTPRPRAPPALHAAARLRGAPGVRGCDLAVSAERRPGRRREDCETQPSLGRVDEAWGMAQWEGSRFHRRYRGGLERPCWRHRAATRPHFCVFPNPCRAAVR